MGAKPSKIDLENTQNNNITVVVGAQHEQYAEPESDIETSFRRNYPADYTLKIDSYSYFRQMMKEEGVASYTSNTFEAGGHQWKLSLYPDGDKERDGKDGDKERDGKGHISLSLIIQETSKFRSVPEVLAHFKFFIYDQTRDRYLTIQGARGELRRFHTLKRKWSHRLLSHDVFNDVNNGYLVGDKCAFGVEIFVNGYEGRGECITAPIKIWDEYTWQIQEYSTLNSTTHCSDVFTMGSYQWKLKIYPKGDAGEAGKSLSLYLILVGTEIAPAPPLGAWAEFKLLVKNQKHGNDVERKSIGLFLSDKGWGWAGFVSLRDVRDASKGFLVDDTLIIEAQIPQISIVKPLGPSDESLTQTVS